ncbi:MAG: hypothetical protein D6717_14155 [Gammaproteobacteria bacterium]|nr:MAG: hypothetical protein D6717_14155 [Gammaproteobacteria bacterium]
MSYILYNEQINMIIEFSVLGTSHTFSNGAKTGETTFGVVFTDKGAVFYSDFDELTKVLGFVVIGEL